MALSNIFREPRRELTEQAYGLVPFAVIIPIWVGLTLVFARLIDGTFWVATGEYLAIGLLLVPATLGGFFLLMFVVHTFGEAICNGMAARGHDPRPKNRPQGR